MALRMTAALVRPDTGAASITQASQFNYGLLLTMAAVLVLFHFSLGFLVMQRLVSELEHLSSHDSLTRLLNRRAFEQQMAHEIAASHRSGSPLGLLLIDIDHFKRVNDRFGHATGDAALRLVAERLAAAARRSDVLARLGGEEFGMLLPSSDAAGIRQAAERLRSAVGTHAIACPDAELPITVSIGASMRLSGETDAEAMLRRADQALYRAKAEGRDRTVFDTLAQVGDDAAEPTMAQAADTV
jgi:diguanylate cyclase (GGDEF)-like protein